MDLGAVLCRPRQPTCDDCPVRVECAWQGSSTQDDPAVGSSGVSTTQARFEGSDRQARGRLMKALSAGAVPERDAAAVMQRSDEIATRLVGDLVADGLCRRDGSTITLPD
jgi:A/G-specific adenine glycosylase